MLNLFKTKNPTEKNAKSVYAAILERVRRPVFYTEYGVPDSFDGRFDLLVLHAFMVMHCLQSKEGTEDFMQTLFDVTFKDMDQTLREAGIGDMGVPKHMRRMMKGFNGRMHGYKDALEAANDGPLEAALCRNLYGTVENIDAKFVTKMKNYVQANIKSLKEQSPADIMSGQVVFSDSV